MLDGNNPASGGNVSTMRRPYTLPDSHDYPSADTFASLERDLAGQMYRPEYPDCSPQEGLEEPGRNSEWLTRQAGAAQYINFQYGWSNDPAAEPKDLAATRGRLPEHLVEPVSAQDVAAAVNFARKHNLRLRVKNTGHDYLGRSTGQGSFCIWTHRLNDVSFEAAFVPEGAPAGTTPSMALVVGAGVKGGQFYAEAEKYGVLVTGVASPTVGVAGGYVLGGGHGPLAPLHGLAAENVLEMQVVTADGQIRRASPYQHPSLFKALRGGGGAFAVVISVTFRAHKPPAGFVGVCGTFETKADVEGAEEAWQALMRDFVALQPKLSDAGPFSGYTMIRRTAPATFVYILPENNLELIKTCFEPFFKKYQANPAINLTADFVQEPTWNAFFTGPFQFALKLLDSAGVPLLVGGRLVPRQAIEQKGHDLGDFLAGLKSPAIVHLVAGRAVAEQPDFPSTVNPAWRDTLLHVDLPVSWPATAPAALIKGTEAYLTQQVLKLGAIAGSTGLPQAAYASEADYNEVEWQDVWYGRDNYRTLLEAKKEWDPTGVFSARKAVGSEFNGY